MAGIQAPILRANAFVGPWCQQPWTAPRRAHWLTARRIWCPRATPLPACWDPSSSQEQGLVPGPARDMRPAPGQAGRRPRLTGWGTGLPPDTGRAMGQLLCLPGDTTSAQPVSRPRAHAHTPLPGRQAAQARPPAALATPPRAMPRGVGLREHRCGCCWDTRDLGSRPPGAS